MRINSSCHRMEHDRKYIRYRFPPCLKTSFQTSLATVVEAWPSITLLGEGLLQNEHILLQQLVIGSLNQLWFFFFVISQLQHWFSLELSDKLWVSLHHMVYTTFGCYVTWPSNSKVAEHISGLPLQADVHLLGCQAVIVTQCLKTFRNSNLIQHRFSRGAKTAVAG